ncbi:MAG: NADPH-dependent 7-cyano-7-deazaguanine reductase QueF [Chlamydiia bacterium]|nr:NADPH-dependent 7-cyano-7-deazaguanine reductase QueF [Chlamydiia bacterium]
MRHLKEAPLGQSSTFVTQYDPDQLFPVARKVNREVLDISGKFPFAGVDVWNAYEVSWLNEKGKPEIAIATFVFPCESPYLIESKSFKLYLNSLNQTHFSSPEDLEKILSNDLTKASGDYVEVKLTLPKAFKKEQLKKVEGVCIDDLDVTIDTYEVEPEFLKVASKSVVEETLYSNLLKSNCLKTKQPDWATVIIHYRGKQIDREGLLKYIVSHRNHLAFHEDTVENIFMDIQHYCAPSCLTVYARYTRRGGMDINPFRSNWESLKDNGRTHRQ